MNSAGVKLIKYLFNKISVKRELLGNITEFVVSDGNSRISKWSILSEISKIFYPLGQWFWQKFYFRNYIWKNYIGMNPYHKPLRVSGLNCRNGTFKSAQNSQKC